MEKWNKIYLFATENVKGYMRNLDLTNKKVITVAASFDQALNAILKGCNDITIFDINPLSKYYADLKIEAIKKLSFNDFTNFLLYENHFNFDYETIKSFDLPDDSRIFWLNALKENDNNGVKLRNSGLFDLKYYEPRNKINMNLYLNEKEYEVLKNKINTIKYKFIHSDLKDLKLKEHYDYGFFSNISDYLTLMYGTNELSNYKKKIDELKNNIDTIYIAYIYDINKKIFRSSIDDTEKVLSIFKNARIEKIETSLINQDKETQDGVIIY